MNFDTYDGRVDPIVALYAHGKFPGGNIDRFIGPLDLDKVGSDLGPEETVTRLLAGVLAGRSESIGVLNVPSDLRSGASVQVAPTGFAPLELDRVLVDLSQESPFAQNDKTDVAYLITDTDFGTLAASLATIGGGNVPEVAHQVVIKAEPGTGDLITHITRQSTVSMLATQPNHALRERLAMVTDPRTWMFATGGDGETPRPGWVQSRPVRASYDTNKQPVADDAPPNLVEVETGMPWGVPLSPDSVNLTAPPSSEPQAFYELVWPGFNRPWGIILEVSYQHLNDEGARIEQPGSLSDWATLRVDYRLKQHLEAPGGPFGRRPVGPSLQPVTVDDGHMTVTRAPNSFETYHVEMYKMLAFQDIVKHRVFDTFEEAMPFLADGWFHSVNAQWLEVLADPITYPTADLDRKWKELPFEPAYDEQQPANR